tara:strand:- start:218 stop:778 length:561 start_codon:yes stop_codon:yes gene_type:complete
MFCIHKSHSKLELSQLINTYNINIINPKKYKKVELINILQETLILKDSLDIPDNNELYHFTNLVDLKLYLTNINPKKILTVKQKQVVILTCKKLKHYCNNNYMLNNTEYKTFTQVYKDAKYIEQYGDIPSVRKVCVLLNNDLNKPFKLQPIISSIVQKELQKKHLYKCRKNFQCTFKHGKFSLRFD